MHAASCNDGRVFIRQFGSVLTVVCWVSQTGQRCSATACSTGFHVQRTFHALAAIGQESHSQLRRTCGGIRSESEREVQMAIEVTQTEGGVVAEGEAMAVAGIDEAVTQPAQ